MATEIEAYIRQRAPLYGVDPNLAVRTAHGEGGLHDPFRHGEGPAPRSQDPSLGGTENSYGPFQLYVSGTGAGLGDRALAAGIDPRKDWKAGVDYALNEISQKGWGQWYGAKAQGITGMMGVGGRPANAPTPAAQPTVMDGPKGGESAQPQGYSTRPQGPVEAAGGGYGSDPLNPAMQQPAGGGRDQLASAIAGVPGNAPAGSPDAGKGSFLHNLMKGIGGMDNPYAGDNTPPRSAGAPQPGAARIDQGDVPTIDPQQAEAQRQMLALAMQRLNSGRLF